MSSVCAVDEKTALLSNPPVREHTLRCARRIALSCILASTALFSAALLRPASMRQQRPNLVWSDCGVQGFDCTSMQVPYNHSDPSEKDFFTLPMARYKGTSNKKLGSLLINPGGPGGSGVNLAYRDAELLNEIFQGHFDIVGVDVRGTNGSRPNVDCFDSPEDEVVFYDSHQRYYLNLPANLTALNDPFADYDLRRQLTDMKAGIDSLAGRCHRKIGRALGWMGTAAVVQDFDYISRMLDGPDSKVNFMGFSYGTLIAQQLVQILPPHRIGRVIADGVVDPVSWSDYADNNYKKKGFASINDVLLQFIQACLKSSKCPLSHTFSSVDQVLNRMDEEIDRLYHDPQPVSNASYPAVLSASHLRGTIFLHLYSQARWPSLAHILHSTFQGNYVPLAEYIKIKLEKQAGLKSTNFVDMSLFPIYCTDTKPYDKDHPPPEIFKMASLVKSDLERFSPRYGDGFIWSLFCDSWKESLLPRQSRYAGSYSMPNDTLHTPMLFLSNEYDPVTPLISARRSNLRMQNNARLIEQTGGVGHCAISALSQCAKESIAAFMVNGTVLDDDVVHCQAEAKDVLHQDAQLHDWAIAA